MSLLRKTLIAWGMKKIEKKELFVPKTIHIEVTNFCNAACVMCPHGKMKRGQGYMSWKLFKKIVEECKAFEGEGIRFFLHNIGEPLLDPSFFEKVKYIKENLLRSTVTFNSNAMLLDENKSRQLLNSGADKVIFSVDGASQETYERIREGLKYDRVKNNLDRFFELKKNSLSKIKVTLQMVVCEDNKSEIEKYKNQWSGKSDAVVFKPAHNFLDAGKSIKTKKLSKKQLHFCCYPFDMMTIYWNGVVGLCCWDYDNFCSFGNIENEKIIDVYNNASFERIREAMHERNAETITPCNRCSRIFGQDKDMTYLAS